MPALRAVTTVSPKWLLHRAAGRNMPCSPAQCGRELKRSAQDERCWRFRDQQFKEVGCKAEPPGAESIRQPAQRTRRGKVQSRAGVLAGGLL